MSKTIRRAAKRRWPTAIAAVILGSTLALGGFAGSASADEHGRDHHDDHHDNQARRYYQAPPVVYEQPYYAPPVVFWPGLNINIR